MCGRGGGTLTPKRKKPPRLALWGAVWKEVIPRECDGQEQAGVVTDRSLAPRETVSFSRSTKSRTTRRWCCRARCRASRTRRPSACCGTCPSAWPSRSPTRWVLGLASSGRLERSWGSLPSPLCAFSVNPCHRLGLAFPGLLALVTVSDKIKFP